MRARLRRVIGKRHDFLKDRKTAFVKVDGQMPRAGPQPPGDQIFHRKRPEGRGDGGHIIRQNLGIEGGNPALLRHRPGNAGQKLGDPPELAEITPGGLILGQGLVVVGEVSFGHSKGSP
jgi:hypothetical protein